MGRTHRVACLPIPPSPGWGGEQFRDTAQICAIFFARPSARSLAAGGTARTRSSVEIAPDVFAKIRQGRQFAEKGPFIKL